MMKMFSKHKMYKYYIAYCYILENGRTGFGSMDANTPIKLKMKTFDDIKFIENFIKDVNRDFENLKMSQVTIVCFKRIRGKAIKRS